MWWNFIKICTHHPTQTWETFKLSLTVSNTINKVDNNFKKTCEDPFNITEIKTCIGNLKDNRAPGNDGLTSEFYKCFINLLAPFILLFI